MLVAFKTLSARTEDIDLAEEILFSEEDKANLKGRDAFSRYVFKRQKDIFDNLSSSESS